MELWQIKGILTELRVSDQLALQIMDSAKRVLFEEHQHPAIDEGAETLYVDPIAQRKSLMSAVVGCDTIDTVEPDNQSIDIPVQLGQYDDLGRLGEGSMGTVRLVYDRKLNRRLAMKIIHPNLCVNDTAASRFAEEAQVCAQLQHPNIVPVHDFGVLSDGRFYFTMKEIKGRSLDTVIRAVHGAIRDGQFQPTKDGWTFHRLIDAFRQVCQAVGYAHSKGVLHRDLKPENIMLGEFGEVLVVDWGLAKIIGHTEQVSETKQMSLVSSNKQLTHATQMGQVAGTPLYMAPEQAWGEIDQLNMQTDVYTLGAIWYEILTGHPPYRGTSPQDILAQVRSGPPPSLHNRIDADGLILPEELVSACEQAMSRLQSERFASAELLASVLQEWLEGAKRREKALTIVHGTDALSLQAQQLKSESTQLFETARLGLKEIPSWESEEIKGPYWDKEQTARAKKLESERLDLSVEHSLQNALSHKRDLIEAHVALAERYLMAHQTAERNRDERMVSQSELHLRHHATALPPRNELRHRILYYLKGLGAVSIQPDIDDVEIILEKYVPHHRRLVPKRVAVLGRSALVNHSLEMGSYRFILSKKGHHDVVYPVHIARGQHWDGRDEAGIQRPIHIPRQGQIGPSECYVPAGWFHCGGDQNTLSPYSHRRVWQDGFVMSRFPITNQEYLCFLNHLLDDDREEEALRFVPKQMTGLEGEVGAMIYGRNRNGYFELVADSDGDVWEPDVPVCMINYWSAEAYCKWISEQRGLKCRLPSDLEWEKAARGVDGRWHVWGDGFDPSYGCMIHSHQDRRIPARINSYPIDESVYGIRGLAGNMSDWTSSSYRIDWSETVDPSRKTLRGGSWIQRASALRTAYRNSCYPSYQYYDLSFRVVYGLNP
ncbi:MAG: bifunctional serine/threonine-protein kinase/formylglycine-generating enzyme family protein [Myxococcota bacterium]|nr:bifunctional serine/threonine-protein kinase/formylglycine-generating enzyme family protein [Myxococcota bacterium]